MGDADYKALQKQRQLHDVGERFAFPWIREVGERFKERGIFPLSLCDYYTRREDVEIAAFLELLFPNANRENYVMEVRNIVGGDLWGMVENREFIRFADLGIRDKFVLKYVMFDYHKIFNMLDWLWEIMVEERKPLEFAFATEKRRAETLKDVVPYVDFDYRYNMLLAKLALRDGFGTGLWTRFKENRLRCPINASALRVLRQFYPIETLDENNASKAIRQIGFKKETDFLYAWWGYERLRVTMPEEIERFERRFPNRLKSLHRASFVSTSSDRYLKEDVPKEIVFD